MGRLRQELQGKKAYFDENIFIYAVEVVAPWAAESNTIFSGLKSNEFSAVTSNLTLSECLVKPFKEKRLDLASIYRQVFLPRTYLNIAPIDDKILILAARLRAETGLKLPDAIHTATAQIQGYNAILTNDIGFKRIPGLEVFILSEWLATPL